MNTIICSFRFIPDSLLTAMVIPFSSNRIVYILVILINSLLLLLLLFHNSSSI